jgi:amino acid adenylation domain-containing protein
VFEECKDDSETEHCYAGLDLYSAFVRQVARRPNNLAVVDAHGKYSYRQISRRALALALSLGERGAVKNAPVAVLCEKGAHQVVSVLGILGAGAAYLPLDPDWPLGRLEEILRRASVRIIVISRAQLQRMEDADIALRYSLIVVDELRPTLERAKGLPNVSSEDVAYVIFTSGSTGIPKGVVISHDNALTTITAVNNRFQVSSQDSVLALSRLSFDLSVYDIFGMLVAGGTIVFPCAEQGFDPLHWRRLIETHQITLWNSVPQLMGLLLDSAGAHGGTLDSLRCVLLSGDWIPLSMPERVKQIAPGATVVSLGGATECSIWSIWYTVDRVEAQWNSIPYGFAMPDQGIHVLNDHGASCAVGVAGNICISGKGVALGYWDDPERTAQNFEQHPSFGTWFKTGDVGFLNPKGYVEFLGRRDQQVKLNGYRVELEEISAKLSLSQGIREAVVLVRTSPSGAPQLAAYYVATEPLSSRKIQAALSRHLPEYMVPRSYRQVAALPLTVNGKVDREALKRLAIADEATYVPPRNELEEKLCRIWATHLGAEHLGIKDDFFGLGGDSLLAIKLAYAMSQELHQFVDPRSILSCRSVESLVSALDVDDHSGEIVRSETGEAPLSFQQEAALAEELHRPGVSAFPMAFEVIEETEVASLKKSLIHVVCKHAALRTRYARDEHGIWCQLIGDQEFLIEECQVGEADLERIYESIYRTPFDLTSQLPIRATIYRTERASYL